MSRKTLNLNDELYNYLLSVSIREHPLLTELRQKTQQDTMSIMQISPEQGQFMGMLIKLLDARQIIEIGTYTGYSSLVMALASHADAHIIACDTSEKWTNIAQHYWQKANVTNKIKLHLQAATETLKALLNNRQANSFDFIFIDADKNNYDQYYELSLQLIRPGGLIAIDNVLWNGDVINKDNNSEDTQAIRALNQKLKQDNRVDISMLPIADGLTLARKIIE